METFWPTQFTLFVFTLQTCLRINHAIRSNNKYFSYVSSYCGLLCWWIKRSDRTSELFLLVQKIEGTFDHLCFIYPGQPPLLAPSQSPSPSTSVPVSGSQIVTAVYPPSPSITVATGVVSMTAVPPSVVHSVTSPSSASSHILSKHTAAATTVTHTHPQLHLDRPSERHLPLDRPADRQMDRQTERQAEMLMQLDRQLDRQGQTSSSSSVAPPSGSTVSIRANSPPLPVQTSGTCLRKHFICTPTVVLINY